MVVGYHYIAHAGGKGAESAWGRAPAEVFSPIVRAVASYGFLGVELFFVISGFVICMSCWGRSPREFLVSRVSRLYPAYVFAVLVTTAVLLAWPVVREPVNLPDLVANVTMFQVPLGAPHVDGVYWSLWVEMCFYLLFTLVVARGLTQSRVMTFCVIWLVASIVVSQSDFPLLRLFAMPNYAPFFIAGITMYLMRRFGTSPSLWALLGFSWCVACYRAVGLLPAAEKNTGLDLSFSVGVAVLTLGAGVVLLAALGRFDRVRWRGLALAGGVTYPLYLLHEAIGWTMIHGLRGHMSPYLVLVAVTVFMVVASWLVYMCVDRPLGRRIRRLLAQ